MALSKRDVENAEPRVKKYDKPDGKNGLSLVVHPSGAKSWCVYYRFEGKLRKYTLGTYSEGVLDLSAARKGAIDIVNRVNKGEDPAETKQTARKARLAPQNAKDRSKTFEETASRFLRRHCRPNYSHRHFLETARLFGFKPDPADPASFIHNAYEKALIKKWGNQPIVSVTETDIVDFLHDIVDGGTPILANNMHTALCVFFGWAKSPNGGRVIETNPCLEIKQPSKEKEGERVLADEELRALWRAAKRLEYPKGTAYRALMLSGQRKSIIAQCHTGQIDRKAGLWTISGEQEGAKGTGHVLPIIPAMAAVFDECAGNSPYLFSTTNGAKPLALGDKIKKEIDALMLDELRKEAAERGDDPNAVILTQWDNHDIRRTMRTRLSALPVPEGDIVRELVIGHRKQKLHKIYDKYAYIDEKRQALELWAAKLASIITPSKGRVVQFDQQATRKG